MPTHRKLFRFRVLLTLSLAYGCAPAAIPPAAPMAQATQTPHVPKPTPVEAINPTPLSNSSPEATPVPSPTPSGEIKLLSVKEIEDVKASGLIEANNRFSWELFHRLYQEKPDTNLFVSPLSAAMALQMVLQGASGETAEQMRKVLKLENIDDQKLRQNFPLLARKLQRPAEDITLEVANSLWASQRFAFRPEFIKSMKSDFMAEANSVDFFDLAVPGQINGWAARATHDKIPEVIEPKIMRPDLLVAILINAIYFKGDWTYPFDQAETRTKPFKLENGQIVEVPMMRQFSELPYLVPNNDFPHQGIALSYGKKGRQRMYVFLPTTGKTLKDLKEDLQRQDFTQLSQRFSYEGGSLELPRFKLKGNYLLNDPLSDMGIKQAFEPGLADFSRMSPTSLENAMHLSSVEQFSYVDVDEKGTEAAAVTLAQRAPLTSSEPMRTHSMIVDHPFIFLIHDEETGQILFMGSVTDPSKEI